MRVAFPLVAQSPSSGSGLVGAQATITKHVIGGPFGGGAAATIYTSETGVGTTGGNTITTDSAGRWTQGAGAAFAPYWLDEGTYDITISGAGLTSYQVTRELVSGAVAANNEQVVTALPTSPYDGQLIWLLADSANGVVWQFRYRAASASAFKWEFVGGPPMMAQTSFAGTFATSPSAPNNGGSAPALTLPTLPNGGDFDIVMETMINMNNVAPAGVASATMSFQIGSGAFVTGPFLSGQAGGVNSVGIDGEVISDLTTRVRRTGLAGGTVLTAKFSTQGIPSPGVIFSLPTLWVTPVRVG